MERRLFRLLVVVVMFALLPTTAVYAQQQEDAASADNQDDLTPAPGRIMRIDFPDLPPTVLAQFTSQDVPAAVLVRIPENYNAEDTFPLYVFLEGGHGGAGSNIEVPMRISGGGDGVIVASFPLFKKKYDTSERWPYVVGADDYEAMSSAYEVILDRLREIIPNIDAERSIIGGHSNGAKALAVLLSGLDENLLESFGGFFFIDGGLNWTSSNRPNSLRHHHIFFLVGGGREGSPWWRKHFINRVEFYRESAREIGMTKWRFETFDGVDHEFAEEYYDVLREWAEGVDRGAPANGQVQ